MGDDTSAYIDILFSGSNVVGALTLEGSSDKTNPITIEDSPISVTGSTPAAYDVISTAAPYVRLTWTYTSGTGNITVKGTCKDFDMSSTSGMAVFPG